MSKLVSYTPCLKTICPNCNKEVEALKLDIKRLQIKDTPWKNTINILGCTDCRFVFFQEEDSEALRSIKKGRAQ